jgi:hypothetical protein
MNKAIYFPWSFNRENNWNGENQLNYIIYSMLYYIISSFADLEIHKEWKPDHLFSFDTVPHKLNCTISPHNFHSSREEKFKLCLTWGHSYGFSSIQVILKGGRNVKYLRISTVKRKGIIVMLNFHSSRRIKQWTLRYVTADIFNSSRKTKQRGKSYYMLLCDLVYKNKQTPWFYAINRLLGCCAVYNW